MGSPEIDEEDIFLPINLQRRVGLGYSVNTNCVSAPCNNWKTLIADTD